MLLTNTMKGKDNRVEKKVKQTERDRRESCIDEFTMKGIIIKGVKNGLYIAAGRIYSAYKPFTVKRIVSREGRIMWKS